MRIKVTSQVLTSGRVITLPEVQRLLAQSPAAVADSLESATAVYLLTGRMPVVDTEAQGDTILGQDEDGIWYSSGE